MCELKYDPSTKEYTQDTCPNGHFCFQHLQVASADGTPYGHCCPTASTVGDTAAKLVCPVGNIMTNATCGLLGNSTKNACTLNANHDCADSHNGKERICCPTACSNAISFATADICYDFVGLNKQCHIDNQCVALTKNAHCKATPQGLSNEASYAYAYLFRIQSNFRFRLRHLPMFSWI